MITIFFGGIFFGLPAIFLTFFVFLFAQRKLANKTIITPFQLLSLVIVFFAFGVYYSYRGQFYTIEPILVAVWFTLIVLFALFYKFGIVIPMSGENNATERFGIYSSHSITILVLLSYLISTLYANNINPIFFSMYEIYNILASNLSFAFKGLGFWFSIFATCYIIILFFKKVDLRFERAIIASFCVLVFLVITSAFN